MNSVAMAIGYIVLSALLLAVLWLIMSVAQYVLYAALSAIRARGIVLRYDGRSGWPEATLWRLFLIFVRHGVPLQIYGVRIPFSPFRKLLPARHYGTHITWPKHGLTADEIAACA